MLYAAAAVAWLISFYAVLGIVRQAGQSDDDAE